MRISNSKLNIILSCPMTYYLNYEQKIEPKDKAPALMIGSAIHKALEDGPKFDEQGNLEKTDLTDHFKEFGNKEQRMNYSYEQLLAECVADGYFKNKDSIYKDILFYKGEQLQLIEEYHELELYGELPSKKFKNEFYGIIDLLLLTNKGFILLDYKTSSKDPDWNAYLEQIYRYVFLIKANFPDIPVLKIGIINLKKVSLRQGKAETLEQFKNRVRFEYELNDEKYINYHEYLTEELNPMLIEHYINNLYKMCEGASEIVNNRNWYINFSNANGQYKSQYWNIFYQTPDAEILYKIMDYEFKDVEDIDENGEVTGTHRELVEDYRDCVKIDMKTIFPELQNKIVNKYVKYKELRDTCKSMNMTKFVNYLQNNSYITDETLLERYEKTYIEQSKKEA